MPHTSGANFCNTGLAQNEAVASTVSPGGMLFFAYLAITFVTVAPFPDLGDPRLLEVSEGNDALSYFLFLGMGVCALALAWRRDRMALQSLLTPAFVGFVLWIAVTCVFSQDPATSMKRAAMFGFIVAGTSTLFLLPDNKEEMTKLLSYITLLVIFLCYCGVVFIPHLAIHQATDLGEAHLAGDWRGTFGHKNLASAVFGVMTFIGLYVKSERPLEGWAIFILSVVFILASGGKSSTLICAGTILISSAALGASKGWVWAALVLAPLVILNLIGVGSVVFLQIGAITATLPFDASFTGRTDIWSFALPRALAHPVFGHGFMAFWNTSALRFDGAELNTEWANTAAHAHNAYLDAFITMGYPGLALFIAAIIVQPARDAWSAHRRGEEPALTLMFERIWIFSLYSSSFETFVFIRAHPNWVALLFAIFSLHYLSRFRLKHASS